MRISTLLCLLSVAVSSNAFAQSEHGRGHHRRHARAELSGDEVYEIVETACRTLLRREPEPDRAMHIAWWSEKFRGMNRREATQLIEGMMRASEEYRCLMQGCAMPDAAFEALLQQINSAAFSSGRLGVVESAAASNRFTVAQLKRIVQVMWFGDGRLGAVALIAPRLVDPQNAFLLDDALWFGSEREEARRLIGS